jgi:hypothetical protein
MKQWLKVAAILIPFVFLSYYSYQYCKLPAFVEEAIAYSEVIVPKGSKTQLVLPDG